jgi:hypothetical protein
VPNQRRPSPIQGVKVDAGVTGGDFIPADRGISVNRDDSGVGLTLSPSPRYLTAQQCLKTHGRASYGRASYGLASPRRAPC